MDNLFEMLGAVYGWCKRLVVTYRQRIICDDGWTRVYVQRYQINEYSWRLLYWPALIRRIRRPVLDRRPLVTRAGFMSESRGLHWDRK